MTITANPSKTIPPLLTSCTTSPISSNFKCPLPLSNSNPNPKPNPVFDSSLDPNALSFAPTGSTNPLSHSYSNKPILPTHTCPDPSLSKPHPHLKLALLPRSSPLFPFTNVRTRERPLNLTSPSHVLNPINFANLLSNPLLSTPTPADPHTLTCLHNPKLITPSCAPSSVSMPVAGCSAHRANRILRKRLAWDLQHHHDRPAFEYSKLPDEKPRADELEKMMASFPGLHELRYDTPPPCPFNEINHRLWLQLHSLHCTNSPPCSISKPAESCYFRPLLFMLTYGYHAPRVPLSSTDDLAEHNPAYISLWNQHPARCSKAFQKL